MDGNKEPKKIVRSPLGRGLSALISSPPVAARPLVGQGEGNVALADLAEQSSEGALRSNLERTMQAQSATERKIISINSNSYIRAMSAPATEPQAEGSGQVKYIDINRLANNPAQPRQIFHEAELLELADSIKRLGVLQPVLVRPQVSTPGKYEIVAGERRWRAAQRAGLTEIPAIVRDLDDRETLEISIVENVQRANLNPVEEARAYDRLATEFSLTQIEIAERVGKERATVANSLRLLKLAPEVLDLLRDAKISTGHAKAILAIKEPGAQISLARKAVTDHLSVRELEALVSRVTVLDAGKAAASALPNRKYVQRAGAVAPIIDRMRNALGTKVMVKHHASGRGRVVIEYFSEAELDRVVEQICR